MNPEKDHLEKSVLTVARKDAAILGQTLTVGEALEAIRAGGIGEKIVYFYVVDDEERLVGVVPTRRLLTSPLDCKLADVMINRVVAIPHVATILDTCEAFVIHKFLAFPVVDEHRRVLGTVDVGLLSQEAFDIAEVEQTDALFETIGFRVSQVRDASPWRAFRFRFPWLAATILSGTVCAMLAGAFELTLAKSLVLAFFLTLVLGLAESVSIQSMTVTIQTLRAMKPSAQWYFKTLAREMATAVLLGAGCGGTVAAIVWMWRGEGLAAGVIGVSIVLALASACFFGLSVPTFLHAMKLDPKIAAGPVTLALTDIFTLLFYFSVASRVL